VQEGAVGAIIRSRLEQRNCFCGCGCELRACDRTGQRIGRLAVTALGGAHATPCAREAGLDLLPTSIEAAYAVVDPGLRHQLMRTGRANARLPWPHRGPPVYCPGAQVTAAATIRHHARPTTHDTRRYLAHHRKRTSNPRQRCTMTAPHLVRCPPRHDRRWRVEVRRDSISIAAR
jgi:hypothetical protein